MTTAPPGILTGNAPRFANGITVPGIAHLEISPAPTDHEWITTRLGVQFHDGDLVLGETLAHGSIRLHYETVEQLRELALAVAALIAWREATS